MLNVKTRADYDEYITSPAWRRVRNHALDLAHYRCAECGARRGLEVHHLTYVRLGHELQSDLRVLCGACHDAAHQQKKFKTLDAPSRFTVLMKLAAVVIDQEGERESVAAIADRMKWYCAKLRIVYDSRIVYDAAAHVVRLRSIRLDSDDIKRPDHPPRVLHDPFSQDGAATATAALLEQMLGPLDAMADRAFPRVLPSSPEGAVDEFRRECGLWSRPDIEARGYLRPPTVDPLPRPRIAQWEHEYITPAEDGDL